MKKQRILNQNGYVGVPLIVITTAFIGAGMGAFYLLRDCSVIEKLAQILTL